MSADRLTASYILPIRRTTVAVDPELTHYLTRISDRCELIIVDDSEPESFAAGHDAWSTFSHHVPPDPTAHGLNGKVRGVLTGVTRATQETIVIADDDVRYDDNSLARVVRALDDVDLVCPQNYFSPVPWHARWDTGRTLLNRAVGTDLPGTVAVRRTILVRSGGYDGDVLFENLELIRTVEAVDGRVASPADLYVRRMPPTTRHFWSQRTRQAYDEFARPWRLALFLCIVPWIAHAMHRKQFARVGGAALAVIGLAERGRRRAGGTAVFPASASMFAPIWLLERSICSWCALGARLRGGVRYGGRRLATAATPLPVLRRRLADSNA